MFCKDLNMLLLYLLSYIELKFENAAVLKCSQVMPVPSTFYLANRDSWYDVVAMPQFSLLEACINEQMLGENCFFSLELIIITL